MINHHTNKAKKYQKGDFRMKIVRTDMELELPLVDQTLIDLGHELILLPENTTEDELCEVVKDCDILLMCYTKITKKIIESAQNLKGIIKYGVGIDAIDIESAYDNDVVVVNIPDYAKKTVAEGAFTLMIALSKKLPQIKNQMNQNYWAWPELKWIGRDISGKTVGIVGCGKIGSSMGRMAGYGFGARVIAYDPYKTKEELEAKGIIKYESLEEVLKESDFLSLHAVLNDETHYLISEKELLHMKKTSFLINTARGALVDEMALLKVLEEGKIAGAAIDVFSIEPINKENHPLKKMYDMENVILFPHLTFYTVEAMERLEKEVLERCNELIEGCPVLIKSDDPRLQCYKNK